ncbi:MAG: PD-(D/E)XK nuclease family protein [Verrucomicrobia bacterium]|nr:PD-(D/E)XK nuclease family protein [Verrucomicrobiota bacterium]MBI3867641.1 PD-(D/E)XK nuclease family protein [Verrucomicrobiota bacterium]
MRAHFLLGPAGSGKTTRCLEEIRVALADPSGAPLLMLAPKQATFQIERQILSFPDVGGYTRLQILSFERLAELALENLDGVSPPLVEEEGRVMVLRALLMELQPRLAVFHATARLPGFARQLSALLRECQRGQTSPARLLQLSESLRSTTGAISAKLEDLALILDAYEQWLKSQGLRDASQLIDLATARLRDFRASAALGPSGFQSGAPLRFDGVWLDGFAEMTPQELDFLAALLPYARRSTLAFCLDHAPEDDPSWLSTWAVVGQTFRRCWQRVHSLPEAETTLQVLGRDAGRSRYRSSPPLRRLESEWTRGAAGGGEAIEDVAEGRVEDSLALIRCVNVEAEAVMAAREILRFVRSRGARFRDTAVLVRSLEDYHATVGRVFSRYGIPFFMDRRSPASHHPLAELTRSALRVVVFGWRHEDVFGALKSGLTGLDEAHVDRLENAALSNGWTDKDWLGVYRWAAGAATADTSWMDRARDEFVPVLRQLGQRVGDPRSSPPSGSQLAAALRELYEEFRVLERLERWSEKEEVRWSQPTRVHLTVWEEVQSWLDNLERAFGTRAMPMREWLPILEAGLGSLTVGVVPPALDQVLVGAVDRSRNPELRLAVVLGMNDSVFPAMAQGGNLLTEIERERLAAESVFLGAGLRRQVGHERYYGYIACTRASERLVLSWSATDASGGAMLPSPFVDQVRALFPTLRPVDFSGRVDWSSSEHPHEIASDWLARSRVVKGGEVCLEGIPSETARQGIDRLRWGPLFSRWGELQGASLGLSADAVNRLYGTRLMTSVSALEDYAACPFKFFVARGLGARERELYDPDHRERGSFQHELLQRFHQSLEAESKRWRDIVPAEAAHRVRALGEAMRASYRGGLFDSSAAARAQGRVLIDRTAVVVQALVRWMENYSLDPKWVEADFGMTPDGTPGLELPLSDGRSVYLRGRVDRVDVGGADEAGVGFVVIVDYKSSGRKLEPLKLEHGLQLQLLAYLAVATRTPEAAARLGYKLLRPAGAFYVCLNPQSSGVKHRGDRANGDDERGPKALQHRGRFDQRWIELLDRRCPPMPGQFSFQLNKDGSFSRRGGDGVESGEMTRLMDRALDQIRAFGEAIFRGETQASPVEVKSERACDRCDYRSICRFDPWVDRFRVLNLAATPGGDS